MSLLYSQVYVPFSLNVSVFEDSTDSDGVGTSF